MLVADDDPTVRRLVELVLERGGCEVTTAADGREAIALARRQPFDVLLLDVQMPGVDGWEVLATLCGEPPAAEAGGAATCPTAAIVMSGHAATAEALRRGARTMLRKPFSPAELLAAVREAAASGPAGADAARLGPLAAPRAA